MNSEKWYHVQQSLQFGTIVQPEHNIQQSALLAKLLYESAGDRSQTPM